MRKRLLLLLTMLLPMVTMADPVEINGICYNLIDKGSVAEVTSNPKSYIGDIVIPETIEYEDVNYKVEIIGVEAFAYSSITSISIPNSVKKVRRDAFFYSLNLTSVSLPQSITSIEEGAFSGCNSLKAVHISDIASWCNIDFYGYGANPLQLGHHLFLKEKEITNLVVPEGVTIIGNYAFTGADSLVSISLPQSTTIIGNYAFADCIALDSIVIPNSVEVLGDYSFYRCTNLKTVSLGNNLSKIGGFALNQCYALVSVTIPDNVREIGRQSFCDCFKLKSVTIGKNTSYIKRSAFSGCRELAEVYCYAKEVPTTENNVFDNSYIEYATLYVPVSSIDSYKSKEPWKNFKDIVKITTPEYTLTYVVDGEEYKRNKIEEGTIIIPEPAPTKEGYTFSGWSEIPETMPAHDVEITGSFTINKYLLTYKVDDEIVKSDSIVYNTAITPEAAPTKEGYTFSGWSEIPETMPAHDVNVTGSFSINTYKLTYMIDNDVYKEVMYEYGVTITPEPQPEGDYASFEWVGLPETMPAHDVTVHASYVTGITDISMKEMIVRIYTPNGKVLNKPQKGLNLVLMRDGTIRKIVIK